MHIVPEKVVRTIATRESAFDAIREAYIAVYKEKAIVFPVVIGQGSRENERFGIKSGTSLSPTIVGLKVGSYWPGNHEKGLPNHGSTTFLLDSDTGLPRAIVGAGYLNGLRTAAGNAVAVSALAREDSRVLGVLGAGHQAIFEARAVCAVRPIESVLIWSRSQKRAEETVAALSDLSASVVVATAEEACRASDIVVTVTPSLEPLLESDWIQPGTHISAMGADEARKQELPIDLVMNASLFADLPAQSRVMGEFSAAAEQAPDLDICSIGAVLTGDHGGRQSQSEVTIFDSSGIALQDLFAAEAILKLAIESGTAMEIEI